MIDTTTVPVSYFLVMSQGDIRVGHLPLKRLVSYLISSKISLKMMHAMICGYILLKPIQQLYMIDTIVSTYMVFRCQGDGVADNNRKDMVCH